MAKQLSSKVAFLCAIGAISPAVGDVITTANDIFINPKVDSEEYKDAGAGVGATKTYTNEDKVTAEFDVNVTARTSGTKGVAPAYAPMLKMCGLKEDKTETEVVYTPTLDGLTATAKAYVDGEYREVAGMVANMTISGKIGKLVEFGFKCKGFTTVEPELEQNPAVTLDKNLKLIVQSATAILDGGDSVDLTSFEFDMGCEIKESYGTDTKEFYIKDFKPTLKINAIKTKGNKAHWTQLKTNTIKAVNIVLGNGEDGNIVELKANYCNPTDVSEKDDDGQVVFEKTYLCESNTGGDNFSLTYK